ncbi:MAG TPA: DUF3151 domain-containing protein [Acidimicrobiales bacterium]|nr:DUF3151 domain-containing protein [Acidimicrobiales bacterium]
MAHRPLGMPTDAPPEVVLPAEEDAARVALDDALDVADPSDRREAVAAVVAARPTFLDAWAALGELGRDPVESYAAARVGYHRGLDALRKNGWKGSGFVRWSHPENRGFLRCVAQLADAAEAIGEVDEVDRCRGFLRQLDPDWPTVDRSR